jgi:SAM-dependent methyltransferase/MoaA/NifB/PqqE/SkfB family radical SAM enzyme
MSKTTCIVPWSSLVIGTDGRATFCCDAPDPLTVGGRIGSLYRDSLDDLWNGDDLVQVRAGMARGEKPAACRVCWQREAAGGVSRRTLANTLYRDLGGRLDVGEVAREGAGTGYRLERRPDWFILELGNVCNLKCRSCSPLFSSRIAADPTHRAWAAGAPAPASSSTTPAPPPKSLQLAPENTPAWFEDVDAMVEMIAGGAGAAGDNAMLSLLGGEPFLIEHTWRLLHGLVARGVAPRLLVGLSSNGQQRRAELADLAPRFRGFNVSLSIDAHGKLYEYLRHGASWRTLVENLRWLRQVPNLAISAVPTLQNGNVLDIVTLLRFLDEHEVPLAFNVLSWPARLRPANLPPSVRRIAAERLRGYLDEECRPANLPVVRSYCEALEDAGDDFDADLFGEFMTFTNDLDAARGESLADAAPELAALIRAAGVVWSGARRHVAAGAAGAVPPPPPWPADVLRRVNRTVSSRDVIFPGFEAAAAGAYFSSALTQLAAIDALLREHGHQGLLGSRAVADFACHYGRLTRTLRAVLPHAAVYACDIDRRAVQFCAAELGALPVVTAWRPDEESLPGGLDAVLCVSLLTHTPIEHWRRALRAWHRMLRPGGVAAFTFLAEAHLEAWLAGTMEHYGSYSREVRAATAGALRGDGYGFAALTSGYGGEPFYGVAFARTEVMRREVAAAGFELLALPAEASPSFSQMLALVRKPGESEGPGAAAREIKRDVSLVALYDPRCYAPAAGGEGSHAASSWARLVAADPPRPLPTELGFGDPRVPEVREAQAALAREHAVDAFCYLYPWGAAGPRWDAPWRDLVAAGRPDFPFCLMVALEAGDGGDRGDGSDGGDGGDGGAPGDPGDLSGLLGAAQAARLLDDVGPGLRDRRYLRLEGRCLLVVRNVARLQEPRAVTRVWRTAAAAAGLGELHLCAAEPAPGDRPLDLGFDSFLEAPPAAAASSGAAAAAAAVVAALSRPWPRHRLFRTVECRRGAADPQAENLYEHWLRSVIDATRQRGEALVFLASWNDWQRGAYLEPDDRDGRAALLATRRAARGPASGLVLLRQLRDALGEVGAPAAAVLGELEQVLALHERSRDRLLASVEVALGRNPPTPPETLRWVPVASRQLPPSGGAHCLDRVGSVGGEDLHDAAAPVPVLGDEVSLAGWAHIADLSPGEVDLFLALESASGTEDRIFHVAERVVRNDVAAAFPGHPPNCGFDAMANIADLPPGAYRIAIVQRTPHAAYRDATAVVVKRD